MKPNKYWDYTPSISLKNKYDPTPKELYFQIQEFPFTPDSNQVIYIESQYDATINNYIKANYNEIKTYFKDCGYRFCYLPYIIQNISDEMIKYRNPDIKNNDINLKGNHISNNYILQYLEKPQSIQPGFIRYNLYPNQEDELQHSSYVFSYFSLFPLEKDIPLEYKIQWYGLHLGQRRRKLYSVSEPEDDKADFNFPFEAKKLIAEIKERVEKLHQIGINEMVINKLFQPHDKLSCMIITSRYDIILPDYHDMKIEMTPLPKAVYFLFLRHPEGIPFKQLGDYKKELTAIYNKVSNRSIVEAMEKSIDDVVDPMSNSINEKCARIREAFISCFDERLANRYFVVGKRGEPKKVTLPRELITWEAPIE
jgi:hypothetical protein